MMGLTSAQVPAVGDADHLRGEGLEVILYVDLGCPHCAATWKGLSELDLSICFRHFPIAAQHPRSLVLHAAAEAAGMQGKFWTFVDRLFADRGRTDDPHLWEAAEEFGLDIDRFQSDRRSAQVAERVQRDFKSGVRAGVSATPAAFVSGVMVEGPLHRALRTMSST